MSALLVLALALASQTIDVAAVPVAMSAPPAACPGYLPPPDPPAVNRIVLTFLPPAPRETEVAAAATPYSYVVTAVNAAGQETSPSAPGSTPSEESPVSIHVSWNAVPGAVKYRVYGRTAGNEGLLAEVPSTDFYDGLYPSPAPPGRRPPLANETDCSATGTTLTVNNAGDPGSDGICGVAECTLREAINTANAIPGSLAPEIRFNLPDSTTIMPWTVLPPVTRPTVINAATQPGYDGAPLVTLDGSDVDPSSFPPSDNGLELRAGDSVVRGLAITGWTGAGILIADHDRNTVAGNDIGIGEDRPGNRWGIVVAATSSDNTIGGTSSSDGNAISANSEYGIWIQTSDAGPSSDNSVVANYVGLDRDGFGAPPGAHCECQTTGNGAAGIVVDGSHNTIGGPTEDARNWISANGGDGIDLNGPGNLVQGNTIGLGIDNKSALGNGSKGILVTALEATGPPNVIGGNLISANGGDGVTVFGKQVTTTLTETFYATASIAGNVIGTDGYGLVGRGNGGNGITLFLARRVTVERNLISGNTARGIVDFLSEDNSMLRNKVGTNAAGDEPIPNKGGIVVQSSQGSVVGDSPADGNVISGNGDDGIVLLNASNAVVAGNLVGTDSTGASAIGNTGYGIVLNGAGFVTVSGNTIAASKSDGLVALSSHDVEVDGNRIGTNAAGDAPFPNGGYGVTLVASALVTVSRNVISGSTLDGIVATGGHDISVTANRIGTNAAGDKPFPNLRYGVDLVDATTVTVSGNTIAASTLDGIVSVGGHDISFTANEIGTNAAGDTAIPNEGNGILLVGASGVTVSGNTISGNKLNGISASAPRDTVVTANKIGTNTAGDGPVPNGGDGIRISGTSSLGSNNRIGGSSAADRNVISGNGEDGVLVLRERSASIASAAAPAAAAGGFLTIAGNAIGTNAAGTAPIGNGRDGVHFQDVGEEDGTTLIGGAAGGNFVSGNGGYGIHLENSDGLTILGNRIGTNAAGLAAIPNRLGGVAIVDGSDNQVGGTDPGEGNVVSGNRGDGVAVTATPSESSGPTDFGNAVEGNVVGTGADPDSRIDLGNFGNGVLVDGVGDTVVRRNTIWHNRLVGVAVPGPALDTTIVANSIDLNGELGIDIGSAGVTPNDHNDVDGVQNFPEITAVATTATSTRITGRLATGDDALYAVELFAVPACDPSRHGEGATFLGRASVVPAGDGGHFRFRASVGSLQSGFVTATAILRDSEGDLDTSEFSECFRVPVADLAATKSASVDRGTVGQQVRFAIDVTNHGPTAATGVTLADALPSGLTLVSVSPEESCTTAVRCTLGTLGSGSTRSVTIVATLNAPGRVCNTATVASLAVTGGEVPLAPVFDPDQANNASAPACIDVTSADLSLTKTASAPAVNVGEAFSYTLTVTNAGPTEADAVMVHDSLPVSMTSMSTAPSQGSCTMAASVVCNLGTLAAHSNATVVVAVRPTASGTFTNTATVTSTTHDPDHGNESDSAVVVVHDADVSLTKTATPTTVTVGQDLTYTLVAANAGPGPSEGVHVVDVLPGSVTPVSVSSTQGTCTLGATVTCEVGTLAAGASATIAIHVRPRAAGTFTNTASATATTDDPKPGNNQASADVVVTSADLSLTKTASPASVTVGQNLTYTLEAANAGPSAADDVHLGDTLPASVTPVSVSSTLGTCTLGTTVSCDIGSLRPGYSATVTIVVRPTASGIVTNSATVTSSIDDPNPDNNTAKVDTLVTSADLSLTKAASPGTVSVGQELTYTLVAANAGPSAAADVRVVDSLPDGMRPVSATSTRGSCTLSSSVVCALGTFPGGASATITIVVRPTAAGEIANTAAVTSATYDPNPGNNEASARSLVASADLSLTKTVSPASTIVGQQLTYTIVVSNAGPTRAEAVRVVDPLPDSLKAVSASSSVGSCRLAATVVCELGTLADGSSATVTIVARVTAAGKIPNDAALSSPTYDPHQGDNRASVSAQATTSADVSVAQTASATSAGLGDRVTFTLRVRNTGPNGAGGVELEDRLGGGAKVVSVTTGRGKCTTAARISCDLGSLASGASTTITVVVEPTAAGVLTSTAAVTGSDPDPAPGNNDATASVLVRSIDLAVAAVGAPGTVKVGNRLTYTVTVRNGGPSVARKVRLLDTIRPGAELVSVTPSKGSCSGGRTVTCMLGSLTEGASETVVLVVRPSASGALVSTATVSSADDDAEPDDNLARTQSTAEYRPTLVLDSVLGPPGTVTFATGRGFPANARVLVTWSSGLWSRVVRTTAAGTFRVPILVFAHEVTGPRRLRASAARPARRGASFGPTDAPYMVVVPTVQVPSFVFRR